MLQFLYFFTYYIGNALLIGIYNNSSIFNFSFLLLLKLLMFFLAVEGFLNVN
jgi:hypothetical protein